MLHHAFDDPPALEAQLPPGASEEEKLSAYRRVCGEIQAFVRDELKLLVEMEAASVCRDEKGAICTVEGVSCV